MEERNGRAETRLVLVVRRNHADCATPHAVAPTASGAGCDVRHDVRVVGSSGIEVRPYAAADEHSWLRCRVLGFLNTAYFDDVLHAKPHYEHAIELVAIDRSSVVGVIDIAIDGSTATIETIAVDPTLVRRGVGTALLDEAKRRLPASVGTLDAWTRDDAQANGWYSARGFLETFRYLHVYATSDEEAGKAISGTRHGMVMAKGFFHARIEEESLLRESFRRVHVCRRYALPLH